MEKSVPYLASVQALRAVAALAVVFYHVESGINGWFAPAHRLPSGEIGAAGVDLFFLVSGFIMVVTSTTISPRTFLVRRIVRIVPLYWLSLAIFLAAAFVVPQREGQDRSLAAIVTSFLFIPYARPDGTLQPLNPVGWTLNYEMMFYLVFALGLAVSRRHVAAIASAGILGVVAAGMLLRPEADALRFWSSPLVVEFVLGMGIGRLFLSGVSIGRGPSLLLAASGLAIFALLAGQPAPEGWWRPLLWGGPSCLVLAGAVLGPPWPVPAWLIRLGDASYAIYLLHLPVLLVFKQLGPRLPLDWSALAMPWLAAAGIVAAAVAVSLATYLAFERPMTAFLRARLGRDASRASGFIRPAGRPGPSRGA